jgi:Uma2 family endonuclease
MAPTLAEHLSVAEFDRLYGSERGWEYWFGEARQKPVPTYLHGLLSLLLGELLRRAGYLVSGESDLRITSDWRPRPDVYGVLHAIEGDYATEPVDVVFEVMSEGDDPLPKCEQYTRVGIPQVFVLDPKTKTIKEWNRTQLLTVADVRLANGVTITGRTIWSELDRRSTERLQPPPSMII